MLLSMLQMQQTSSNPAISGNEACHNLKFSELQDVCSVKVKKLKLNDILQRNMPFYFSTARTDYK